MYYKCCTTFAKLLFLLGYYIYCWNRPQEHQRSGNVSDACTYLQIMCHKRIKKQWFWLLFSLRLCSCSQITVGNKLWQSAFFRHWSSSQLACLSINRSIIFLFMYCLTLTIKKLTLTEISEFSARNCSIFVAASLPVCSSWVSHMVGKW